MDLQRDIFHYKNGTSHDKGEKSPEISKVWEQFMKVFSNDKINLYASGEKASALD